MNIIHQQLYFPKISHQAQCLFPAAVNLPTGWVLCLFSCQFLSLLVFFMFECESLITIYSTSLVFWGTERNADCGIICLFCVRPSSCNGHSSLLLPVPKGPPLPSPAPQMPSAWSNTHICKLVSKKSGWNQRSTSQVYIIVLWAITASAKGLFWLAGADSAYVFS